MVVKVVVVVDAVATEVVEGGGGTLGLSQDKIPVSALP